MSSVGPSRLLLLCGLLAGPLFVVTFLLEGASRDGYDPLRHPVSSLALGPGGWVQIGAFLTAGLLTLAFAVGLRRSLGRGPGSAAGPLLIGVWGVGLLGAGVFVTDPVSGYPAGTPATPDAPSRPGLLHDLAFSLPGFVGFAAAMVVLTYAFARRHAPGWAIYSGLSAIAFLVLFVLASAGFAQDPRWVSTAGLLQRLAVGVGWLWLGLLAARRLTVREAA
ncbi:DUF998 domain-containing protein [Actinoplanes auranticolor]|uniref:DUF998 domain-containing protein n=1 Tax=Actinoplanes auranticolor TaxID=47988 RepID=A0A919VI23_9ACTN|nr:DUF998 domain-containing protein [Actinoplanes auranticolor]GIM62960.1 hypothetical protein Aau02nite_00970 [Actinoplanes auranticolor]